MAGGEHFTVNGSDGRHRQAHDRGVHDNRRNSSEFLRISRCETSEARTASMTGRTGVVTVFIIW